MTGTLKFDWDATGAKERMVLAATVALGYMELDAYNWWDLIAPVGDDPRTSGELKASWFSDVVAGENGVWLTFGAGVRYAIFVELGTGRMPPRAPLRTVAGEVFPFIEPYLQRALSRTT